MLIRLFAATLAFMTVSVVAIKGRAADAAAPCETYDPLIACAATEVGEPCEGAGMCYAITCGNSAMAGTTTIYKCDVCPVILAQPDGGCPAALFPSTCADGGTCRLIEPYCNTTQSMYLCAATTVAIPTGPPATASNGGCGCSVARSVSPTGSRVSGLLFLWLAAIILDRRRK